MTNNPEGKKHEHQTGNTGRTAGVPTFRGGEMTFEKDFEKITPPLDLCRKIPEGEFADSAMAWYRRIIFDDYAIYPRLLIPNSSAEVAPAPTLEEVLREMARYPHKYNNAGLEVDGDAFIVGAWLPNRGTPGAHLTEYRDQNGAAAALKLYLHRDQPEEKKEEKTPCHTSSN